jgi:hypothetical protein
VVKEVHRLRGTNSAQWLANRTKELGHEVSRSVIADLENGRRRYVTTVELVMLAIALRTSPVALMYPIPPGDGDIAIEISPTHNETLIGAAQWFSGLVAAHEAHPFNAEGVAEYNENLKRLRTWREDWELDRRRDALLERLWTHARATSSYPTPNARNSLTP